jgi:protein TonB
VAGVLAAHVVAGWALLQVDAVRQTVALAAPLVVDFITLTPPKPEMPPPPPPPPPQPRPMTPRKPAPTITAAPTPAPAPPAFVAKPAPPEPPPPVVVVNPPPAEPAPPAPPAPPPPPKTLPATAVQYLEPPAPVYPTFSRRSGESGRVVVRTLIDERGVPRQLALQQSSGYARLDDSAVAAIKSARFKPYTENGAAQPFWVLIPIVFDLEK